jgi:hypothetical protein
MAAILLETDEIIVKPFDVGRLAGLVRAKLATRRPAARVDKERVGVILRRCRPSIVEGRLVPAKQSKKLSWLPLSDNERTGHLPKLLEDLALRLSKAPVPPPRNGCQRFSVGHGPWRVAISAGLHFRHAGARIANTPGDHLWDSAEQYEPS